MIRFAEILAGIVAASLLAALYFAKSGAAADQVELANLQAELARERGRISALRAEIAHQEDGENLRELARLYLGFEPVTGDQEIAFTELPRFAAGEPDAAASAIRADLRLRGEGRRRP